MACVEHMSGLPQSTCWALTLAIAMHMYLPCPAHVFAMHMQVSMHVYLPRTCVCHAHAICRVHVFAIHASPVGLAVVSSMRSQSVFN